jgi:hypothetical protein
MLSALVRNSLRAGVHVVAMSIDATDLGRQWTNRAWRHYCANAVLLDALSE